MITNNLQKKTYDAVAAALPFSIDPQKITVEPGLSYLPSPIKLHDYAAGVLAAFGSVVEHLGTIRGLPAQTMKLNRRACGFHLNELQLQFLNGYSVMIDDWPMGPDNGTYRAKDGRYVTIIGLHPHLRDALLDYFQCADSTAAIQKAVEKKTAQQLEDEVNGLGLALGMVRSPEEWLAHPQGAATAKRAMVDIEQKGNARKRALGKAKYRPLEGVRVVELTHLVAGPTTGLMLAEQGADVIKVQPPRGDWVTPIWLSQSWGKKNILLDIKSPDGKKRFLELLASAHVFLSGERPGALEEIGLGETSVREINPDLVFANEHFCPPGTPWEMRRGFEQITQAVTGAMHAHSEGLGLKEPTVVPALMNDAVTGYLFAISIVAALTEREEKGGFWSVGASLTRCSTLGTTIVEPLDAEQYTPVTVQDLIDYGVDQETPWGTFTRIAPPIQFSHTPSMALRPTSWPGTDPDTIGWTEEAAGKRPPKVPHYPSKLAREGRIRNLVSCFGIEDRGDGGGVVSLRSKPEALKAELQRFSGVHAA
jgi:crotonobetainyl-CoA:carnitine CoA-transferase CaiB-like acyl-CoA transferase